MSRGPHRLLEAEAGVFIPRSRRDEILGDLCERYTSPLRYACDAVQAVPAVLASEAFRAITRRRRQLFALDRRRFTMHAIAGQLLGWLGSSGAVTGRSPFGLLGTVAWLFLISMVQTSAADSVSEDVLGGDTRQ